MANNPGDRRNKANSSKWRGAKALVIPGEISEETKQMLIRYHFGYSVLGLIFGLVFAVLGVALFFGGISGSTSLVADIVGAKSRLSDAPPGALLFIIGLFIIFFTRFNIKIQR